VRTHILLAAALLGCSSAGSTSSAPANCADRNGTFTMRYTQRSGTCGAIPEQVVMIKPGLTVPSADCPGEITTSNDNCAITSNVTCAADVNGNIVTKKGKFTWDAAGAKGSGIVELMLTDKAGKLVCLSTYDVVTEKI